MTGDTHHCHAESRQRWCSHTDTSLYCAPLSALHLLLQEYKRTLRQRQRQRSPSPPPATITNSDEPQGRGQWAWGGGAVATDAASSIGATSSREGDRARHEDVGESDIGGGGLAARRRMEALLEEEREEGADAAVGTGAAGGTGGGGGGRTHFRLRDRWDTRLGQDDKVRFIVCCFWAKCLCSNRLQSRY